MKKDYKASMYAGVAQKGFKPALKQFMLKEFPSLMGPKVLDLFISEIEKLIDAYYPPLSIIKPGQVLWYAVAKEDKPTCNKTMKDTKLVPVILTLITTEDIEQLLAGKVLSSIQKDMIIRMYNEAFEQGGVLATADISVLIRRNISTISKITRDYEKQNNKIVPRRGTIHDLGKSLSHKRIICKKRVLEKKNTEQIARETDHSPQDVERYTNALKRVGYCLRKGLSPKDIAFITSMSENLTNEYVGIYNEYNNKANEEGDEQDIPVF
jgi:hypothetical protein